MKKKVILFLANICLVSGIYGCGNNNNENNQNSAVEKKQEEVEEEVEEVEEVEVFEGSGTLVDFVVSVKDDYKIEKDYTGKPTIILNYDFTNNSNKPARPDSSITINASQNGIELYECIIGVDDFYSNSSKTIKPGITLEDCQTSFLLENEVSPVEIEISQKFPFTDSDKKIIKTFNLQ